MMGCGSEKVTAQQVVGEPRGDMCGNFKLSSFKMSPWHLMSSLGNSSSFSSNIGASPCPRGTNAILATRIDLHMMDV